MVPDLIQESNIYININQYLPVLGSESEALDVIPRRVIQITRMICDPGPELEC